MNILILPLFRMTGGRKFHNLVSTPYFTNALGTICRERITSQLIRLSATRKPPEECVYGPKNLTPVLMVSRTELQSL
jgi:hypothetical protein